MGDVGYVAWLRRKQEVLNKYINERQDRMKRYHDEIGQMAEGMSTFGQLEY
jgi:hypothetical protein